MYFESELAGLCLYRLIKNNNSKERTRCLKAIQVSYGNEVAQIVRTYLESQS